MTCGKPIGFWMREDLRAVRKLGAQESVHVRAQGWSLSFVTQYDVDLVKEIEGLLGHQLEAYDMDEAEVLRGITKVRNLGGMGPTEQWRLSLFGGCLPWASLESITETNRIHLVLFDTQNRTLHPYLAVDNRFSFQFRNDQLGTRSCFGFASGNSFLTLHAK
jgi:hypothetical protein